MKPVFVGPVFLAGASALALALAGCGDGEDLNQAAATINTSAPLPQIAAPNNGDWTQTVQETPEGGYRMGNPDAPVKLVEYASITCPHCAEFTEQASQELRDVYVRSGQVSWEYRPVNLFPSDPGIFLLLKCQGPTPFFRLADQLYATQAQWIQQLQAQAAAINAVPAPQRVRATVQAAGIDQFFRQRGMPAGRVDSCLADQQALERFLESSQRTAQADNVTGTPTFFINGRVQENVGYWNDPQNASMSLENRLRAAIGS